MAKDDLHTWAWRKVAELVARLTEWIAAGRLL